MDVIDQKRYSIAEAVEKVGMSKGWWRAQILQGKIGYIQIGKKIFITEETLRNIVKVFEPTETESLSKRVI